jgi:transposase
MECSPSNIISLSFTIQKQERVIKKLEKRNKEQAQTILILQSDLETSQSEITELKSKITELEARLLLNSDNSSFPPSRDIVPALKPVSLRKKTGRKVGGQKGHKGVTRTLSKIPNKILLLPNEICPCGCSLLETKPIKVIRHQIYDIPISPVHITEYQSEVKICPACSRKVSPPFPAEAKNTINFGPNIRTFALY